jgi:asparagine synthase (glutamine-hydrolysing)
VVAQYLPKSIVERKDKMGFPVPLTQWFKQDIHEFVMDIFRSHAALGRDFVNNEVVSRKLFEETNFGRATWGWLSLELWQQAYHDRHETYRQVLTAHEAEAARRETEDTRIQQAN